jgi:hypothetical protein
MADGILPPRPARIPFFRTASDDEIVDLEAFIQGRCAVLFRPEAMYWRPVRPALPRTYKSKGRYIVRPFGWYRRIRFRHRKVDLGMRGEFQAEEMRRAIERATLVDAGETNGLRRLREPQWLRGKVGDLLESLPPRSELNPFVGVYARSADLAAFAKLHWGLSKETQTGMTAATDADEQRAGEPTSENTEPASVSGKVISNRPQRVHPLTAEIAEAQRRAPEPGNQQSVWGELQKLAEHGFGILIGYSSDGVQYRGKKHKATGEYDVFTLKNLADRLYREKMRAKTR